MNSSGSITRNGKKENKLFVICPRCALEYYIKKALVPGIVYHYMCKRCGLKWYRKG
jgi:ribosomal protein L37E